MSTNACSNVFVGLDWAVHTHAVCVIDITGGALERFEIAHDRAGLGELMQRLARFGARVRIAIERPSGLIVDALVEAGHHVFPIHPNAVKASRPRYRSHGAKSDASDAYLLADLLRTDGHRWRELSPQSDSIRALRALVRSRDDLVATRVALGNQLHSTLEAFWPGAACIFCDITSPIALAFLKRYPSAVSAARLSEAALNRFCRSQHYSGRRSPAELLARLNGAATGLAGPLTNEAAGQLVRSMVAVLQPLVEQIAQLTRRIERFIESLPDGQIIMSFPRAGRVCAAQILAELGDVRERFPTLDQLAAEAGAVPVTYQSGKTRSVAFRWACNHRLRQAITCLADNSRHANDWARTIYAAARARGCDHPHAIRILARAWLRIIWRAWTDRTPYDPERHLGALKLASSGEG
ncbi:MULTISPECIES: IS110 family transposase [unclassified Variovorax]|uniref:IS110 family transposase n=1 Tax=unclassified Variovorax TaxID=663243 RepID=UPI003ED0B9EE